MAENPKIVLRWDAPEQGRDSSWVHFRGTRIGVVNRVTRQRVTKQIHKRHSGEELFSGMNDDGASCVLITSGGH